ncbi:MAG TPA: sulfatase-like hydrolase/transferase [Thermoanaerobaculia bacterium]|nr:sulfatase-like hydrolase/transferase [Thermoanaerobaculia bacterium]
MIPILPTFIPTLRAPRLVLLAVAALLLTGPGAAPGAAPPRPNLVLVLTDDMDLDLHALDYMPKVHALLAAKGTTFASYFVPISLCCPSRTTILTGQYSHNHHVYTNFPPDGGFETFQALELDRATIGTALERAGYRTVLMGKYLNGYPKGGERNYVPPGWSEWYVPTDNDAYSGYRYEMNENGKLVAYGKAPEDYMTDVLAAKANDFVGRAAAAGQPFFVYLATYAPHTPATPAPRHQALFPNLKAPRTPSFNQQDVRGEPAQYRAVAPLGAGDIGAIDAFYRRRIQSLQAVDELVAGLVQKLAATGQLDHTYIVFTSDNGLHMGQHRFLPGKYTAYEEDIHVPLIVRGPGVPAGRTVDDLALSVDLAPTFAELAGTTLPGDPDGRSLVPLLTGAAPADWRQAILVEQRPFPSSGKRSTPWPAAVVEESRQGRAGVLEPRDAGDLQRAGVWPPVPYYGLRTRSYKYVLYASGEQELYDLRADPYEMHNLQPSARASFLVKVAAILAKLHACAGEGCRAAESVAMPALPRH